MIKSHEIFHSVETFIENNYNNIFIIVIFRKKQERITYDFYEYLYLSLDWEILHGFTYQYILLLQVYHFGQNHILHSMKVLS